MDRTDTQFHKIRNEVFGFGEEATYDIHLAVFSLAMGKKSNTVNPETE